MSSKTTGKTRFLSLLLALVMAIGMMMMSTVSVFAEPNQAVKEDANGVFLIGAKITFSGRLTRDDGTVANFNKDSIVYPMGTAFLINDTTLLTCYHCIDASDRAKALESLGLTVEKEITYKVVVNKDVMVDCTYTNGSEQDDYAILTLKSTLGGKSVLKLDDQATSETTDKVYSLGFPESITITQMVEDGSTNIPYDRDDVTITEGNIQKLTNINNTDVVQHGCTINPGNSGGPLVNEDGVVVGINKWYDSRQANYAHATAIGEVIKVLKSLNIPYTPGPGGGGSSAPQPTDAPKPEDDTVATTAAAPVVSTTAPAQPTTVAAKAEAQDGGMDMTKLIIIIAIAVLAVIVIVVIIVIIVSSKKKNKQRVNPPQRDNTVMPGPGYTPQMKQTPPVPSPRQPSSPYPSPYMGVQATVPNNEGAGETSVLNDGAGETTVLGGQSAGFTLRRKRNNETFTVNKAEFAIGKERRRVDYCISDNNSVSRVHAKLRVHAGRCYIVDMGSTNCTYVNGSKLTPNQEVILSKGDQIKISDEEFEFIG